MITNPLNDEAAAERRALIAETEAHPKLGCTCGLCRPDYAVEVEAAVELQQAAVAAALVSLGWGDVEGARKALESIK
jgi:hypothetical protein